MRRFFIVSLMLLCVAGCGQWRDLPNYRAPLYKGELGIIETHSDGSFDSFESRLHGRWPFDKMPKGELGPIASDLVDRFPNLNSVISTDRSGDTEVVIDRRFFLISVHPNMIAVVPHVFESAKTKIGDRITWHAGSVGSEMQSLLKSQREAGIGYGLVALRGISNYGEASDVFPDHPETMVLMEGWATPRLLSEALADPSWGFALVPFRSGFVRIVKRQSNLSP